MLLGTRTTRRAFCFLALASGVSASIVACQSGTPGFLTGTNTSPPSTASPGATPAPGGGTVQLTGAGASFPAPLYQRWFFEYNKRNPNVQVSYQSIGSGGGIKQFTDGTVDFGASDAAMTDEQIAKVDRGVLMVPMTAGGVVLAYNLPGVQAPIRLSREIYADIFLGKIKTWDDPRIAKLNPDAKLPDLPITVVHRSDGSGTTFLFTNHLSAISPQWKEKVGVGTAVKWPTGVGAKGNEGVTAQIQQTPGAIGYIEYSYARENKIPTAALENREGNYVEPSPQTSASALAQIKLPENFRAFEPDPTGVNAYPIVGLTWLLVYRKGYNDPQKLAALKDVIQWSLTEGQKLAEPLGYVPLPDNITSRVIPEVQAIGK
ncbi:MAG: phosphate ABC transporter substrate-binding protein PstS [Leptolyngbyaceae bacterium]|nr:phosphate ABC transporter substrate-binding protein PstS [Leptolyngbyaceae bacterium]